MPTSHMAAEIVSQPDDWRRAAALAPSFAEILPQPGERVAVVGCGSSAFMGHAYAYLREKADQGDTDSFVASEFRARRHYDRIVAISRSGTTTEVLRLLAELRAAGLPTVGFTASKTTPSGEKSPLLDAVNEGIVLDFADERSVVQTRFGTAVLALLRAHLGEDLTAPAAAAEDAVREGDASEELRAATQFTFLGRGWGYFLAEEAALKVREAAGDWAEAYPSMEYRHGPITIAAPGRVVWSLDTMPSGLAAQIRGAGGIVVESRVDPMAELIRIQRLSEVRARAKGRNPDQPPLLGRSVLLSNE